MEAEITYELDKRSDWRPRGRKRGMRRTRGNWEGEKQGNDSAWRRGSITRMMSPSKTRTARRDEEPMSLPNQSELTYGESADGDLSA